MQIVLPGALPDPREARELTPHMLKTAPTLGRWLEQSRAAVTQASPAVSGCTPYERWQLARRGFVPGREQNFCAGLGPLWGAGQAEPGTPDAPVWLAELVHVSPSREGARLLAACQLDIAPDESVALFEAAHSAFDGSGFQARPLATEHWRIIIEDDFSPVCASPRLVSLSSVNEWWPQEAAARPWRKLVNELQMTWFEHPVNLARQERGLPAVNSLWLFGGARPEQFPAAQKIESAQVHEELLDPMLAHDWSAWLQALGELETRVLQPLASTRPAVVLIGSDKYVELKNRGRLAGLLPGARESWRSWWSPRD